VSEGADQVEHLVRQHAGAQCRIEAGPVWLRVLPPAFALPGHGWKLHVSSRAATFRELVEKLLPLLLDEGCAFKLARSAAVLSRLNDGHSFPATVGKAVTIYPDQRRVADLGRGLARALRGHQGPRVLSDRRVSESAPVYYRYGPFASTWESDERGRLKSVLRGPAGEPFEAMATLVYCQPAWAADPFQPAGPGPAAELLGGLYRVVSGLRESATGNVYRAVDQRDGVPVVVKQARALVAESGDGIDTRLRLRNERRVLHVLNGIAGTPRYLDHFRHGDDEFLVTSDCGARALVDDVSSYGPYRARGPRSLARLARDLARTLTAIHERGVVMRDLSPKNVVIGERTVAIIDFGIAAYDGVHLPGRTAGYAPARQVRDEQPADTDDLYALGMTLLFAATGLEPVQTGDDPDLPRVRALQAVRSRFGTAPTGVVAAVPDLLSADAGCARAARARLASGSGYRPKPAALAAPPRLGHEQAAEVAQSLLADVVGEAGRIVRGSAGPLAERDSSVYSGTAGIGRELLRHAGDQAAAGLLPELAAFTARTAVQMRLPPGLFTGSTGVAVFLQEARDDGIEAGDVGIADLAALPAGWVAAGDDLIAGAAGAGIGFLLLHHATGDPAWLGAARCCAETIQAHDRPDPRRMADLRATGLAHGLAGSVEFMLTYAARTGDALAFAAAAQRTRQLAERLPALFRQALRPSAPPLAMSWCRGMAGIGRTLLHASEVLGDPALASDAARAADACIAGLPGLAVLGQCCGAAGVGEFLIDLAATAQQERYWAAAQDVAVHMLLRSSGPPGHPVFTEQGPDRSNASWAAGLAGLLAFFRRLATGTPYPVDWWAVGPRKLRAVAPGGT
jgi:tRNA A-37 threonylcarbamoyl transferase component Bud32